MSEGCLTSEKYWQQDLQNIPGSTRIPITELKEVVDTNTNGAVILDLGSGEGRSTSILRDSFPKAKIIAFDLNRRGLEKTSSEVSGRVQGTALELPFENECSDAVVLCGVMTNITDKDPMKALEARRKIIQEVARVLKPGGVCVLSDFSQEHNLSDYPVNYQRHQLITGEYGTIAVFDPEAKVTFLGKSNEEVAGLKKSPYLQRFAHHYSPGELTDLIESEKKLTVKKCSTEVGRTPTGKPIDTLIVTFTKK
jgi:ubiquinone/menaquinone biosynthesis C-methylase UbiE